MLLKCLQGFAEALSCVAIDTRIRRCFNQLVETRYCNEIRVARGVPARRRQQTLL